MANCITSLHNKQVLFHCASVHHCTFQRCTLSCLSLGLACSVLDGQLQGSWEPFGDHEMKLVAFKTIHVHAFDVTQDTFDLLSDFSVLLILLLQLLTSDHRMKLHPFMFMLLADLA